MANAQASQNDWMKSQQQYWDSWFEAQRKAFGGAPSSSPNPWTDFFKEWQNAVSGQQTPDTDAFRQCFTKAGETYMNMLQQFYQGTGQAKPLNQMAEEWISQMQNFFSGNKDPLQTFDPLGFYASMPGIGYTREKQEQMSNLYKQWTEYERKMRDYNNSMSKVGMEALQKFQAYLSNPPKDAPPLTSLKEVYGKWVDVCEEIYARYAMTPEYTKLYGDVVNALMTFKKQQNKAIDEMVDQFNLPTRQEVDSLHKQVHALKRELAALKPKAAKPAKKGKKS